MLSFFASLREILRSGVQKNGGDLQRKPKLNKDSQYKGATQE